ncbi:MAG: metalloregulator ArsR/SmtB family transcription factor [Anaerolineales bacterium]|nr:metalloregulator ArsR/SmtB family transcription factor [Anaerolineales bacterium]
MTDTSDSLSQIFSALADPTRRGMLAMLAEGEKTVTELVESFDLSQPAISKHLKVLEQSGLIERTREAQWRPARLQAAPLKEAFSWVEQYRQYWEQSFDRLGDYLRSVQTEDVLERKEEADKSKKQPGMKPSEWKMF